MLFLSAAFFIIPFGLLQERFIVALLRWLHRSRWGNLYLCGLNSQSLLSFAHCCFSCTTIPKLFSYFLKASTSYGHFRYVSYDIFAYWFSLNQMFKFSVSFAAEVEKKNKTKQNRPSHECFKRGLRSTKDLKRATGHLSPLTNNVRDLKSLLLSWETWMYPCSFKCLKSVAVLACVWLPPFLFFIFYFSVVCCSVSLADSLNHEMIPFCMCWFCR